MTSSEIKQKRLSLNLTQREFGEKLGHGRLIIASWESGRRNLRNKCTIDAIKNMEKK